MDLITRRVIAKREGENVSDRTLADYADPNSTNYKEMLEETRKELYKEQKSSTTIVKEQKVYPNDPCPCGSGKKYKKCCGRK